MFQLYKEIYKPLLQLSVLSLCFFLFNSQATISQRGLEGSCLFNESPCSNRGRCTSQGLCLCNTNYYGQNCENEIVKSQRTEIKNGQITGGGIAGMVIGILVGLIVLFIIGCYFTLQQDNKRGYKTNYVNRLGIQQQSQAPIRISNTQLEMKPLNQNSQEKFQEISKQLTAIKFFPKPLQVQDGRTELYVTLNDPIPDAGQNLVDKLKQNPEIIEEQVIFVKQEKDELVEINAVPNPPEEILNEYQTKIPIKDKDEEEFKESFIADERYSLSQQQEGQKVKPRQSVQNVPQMAKMESNLSLKAKESGLVQFGQDNDEDDNDNEKEQYPWEKPQQQEENKVEEQQYQDNNENEEEDENRVIMVHFQTIENRLDLLISRMISFEEVKQQLKDNQQGNLFENNNTGDFKFMFKGQELDLEKNCKDYGIVQWDTINVQKLDDSDSEYDGF